MSDKHNNKSDKILCFDSPSSSDSSLLQQFLNSSTNVESEEPGKVS